VSDDYQTAFYGYTRDGQLVYAVPTDHLNFVVEPFQRKFTVFQNDTRSFLAARAVLSPYQSHHWCGCLELSTIVSIQGNLEVNITAVHHQALFSSK